MSSARKREHGQIQQPWVTMCAADGAGETPTLTPCVSHKGSLGGSHDEKWLVGKGGVGCCARYWARLSERGVTMYYLKKLRPDVGQDRSSSCGLVDIYSL